MFDQAASLQAATPQRVYAALEQAKFQCVADTDGRAIIPFYSHFMELTHSAIENGQYLWRIHAPWGRSVNIAYLREVKNLVQRLNGTIYAPKIAYYVMDEGKIRFKASWAFNWGAGATDTQILQELNLIIGSTNYVLSQLSTAFPDPWENEGPDSDA